MALKEDDQKLSESLIVEEQEQEQMTRDDPIDVLFKKIGRMGEKLQHGIKLNIVPQFFVFTLTSNIIYSCKATKTLNYYSIMSGKNLVEEKMQE